MTKKLAKEGMVPTTHLKQEIDASYFVPILARYNYVPM